MTPKTLILLAAGAAALALPAAVQAQPYWGGGYSQPAYRPSYDPPRHEMPRGDYGWRGDDDRGFDGYPEFRGLKQHIRRELGDADISPRQAEYVLGELRRIQWQEQREFREHGWRLPERERYEIRSRLQQLDARVDRARD
jgi:hypothetical protein